MLNPSRVDLRIACAGSRKLEEQFPELESIHSTEGTLAHKVAVHLLKTGEILEDCSITQELIDHVAVYVTEVNTHSKGSLHIEAKLDISNVHPDCKGIVDSYVIVGDHAYIYEFKYGMRPIEAYENWQLLEYALGVYKLTKCTKFTLVVVQPRAYHPEGIIRRWELGEVQLLKYFDKIRIFEHLASQDIAPCTPNPLCLKCRARPACKALREFSLRLVDFSTVNSIDELPIDVLADELTFLRFAHQLLETRILALEEETKAYIKDGFRVPGFRLESVSKRESWTKSVAEIIALGGMIGIKLDKEPALITPKQAKNLGFPESLIPVYIKEDFGALKLVSDDKFKKLIDLQVNKS